MSDVKARLAEVLVDRWNEISGAGYDPHSMWVQETVAALAPIVADEVARASACPECEYDGAPQCPGCGVLRGDILVREAKP